MAAPVCCATPDEHEEHIRSLDRRLEEGAWGLFLVMIGALWLMPEAKLPDDTWLIGAGVIMLALNAARRLNGIRVHALTVILGFAAVLGGVAGVLSYDVPVFATLVLIFGAWLVVRQLMPRTPTAHTAPR